MAETPEPDQPAHRYTAALAGSPSRPRWQDRWEAEGTFHAPNPVGDLADGLRRRRGPRPSATCSTCSRTRPASGLHVGHPLGFIGTDVYARYLRMTGHNVIHTMGYDAFGLPAEQYALQTNTHPRVTTEANIANMRRQLRRLGLAHDPRRSVATTDPDFYRWTQWIFLQLFDSWYDTDADRARPVAELEAELDAGTREPAPGTNPSGTPWSELDASGRRKRAQRPPPGLPGRGAGQLVPGPGHGAVQRGGHRRRALASGATSPCSAGPWSSGCSASPPTPTGCSTTSTCSTGPTPSRPSSATGSAAPPAPGSASPPPRGDLEVFTTRPDTLFGATYMVVAPEHPLVEALTAEAWPDGTPPVWTGGSATPADAVRLLRRGRPAAAPTWTARPATGPRPACSPAPPPPTRSTATAIPVFVADYVLMGYGTGAIMAVPGQDQRDWDFAEAFDLPIVRTVDAHPTDFDGAGLRGRRPGHRNSDFLDGMAIAEAKAAIIAWLVEQGAGTATVQYKLRDWLFSRQRYWGEPFPIVFGDDGEPRALPADQLPLELPPMDDFTPDHVGPGGLRARAPAGPGRGLGHRHPRPGRRRGRPTAAS